MTDAVVHDTQDPEEPPVRGIFNGFSGYVTPTNEDWQNVLSNGMVVVDTNVLLNLYRYNRDARTSLVSTLERFGTRLWVPNQVMVEFWRNRDSALEDPEKQLQQSISVLRSNLDKSIADLRSWVNRVSLDRPNARNLEAALQNAFDEVIGSMERVVDSSGLGMGRETYNDGVISVLSALLDGKVGGPLEAADYANCIAEGKRRLEAQVPPGYKDKKKEARGDDSEVGDYLVWLQLMREAKSRSNDVLLVTGDTKEDWWRLRNRMTVGPRNELAEELLREAGVRLYMLKPDRLLVLARDILEVAVSEDSVQNVEMVDAQSTSNPPQLVGNWSYPTLVAAIRKLRERAPAQERVMMEAVYNGILVSADRAREIQALLSSGSGRKGLRDFVYPVTEVSMEVAAEEGLSVFQTPLLEPVYAAKKTSFARIEGFRVDPSLHKALVKAWALLNESPRPEAAE